MGHNTNICPFFVLFSGKTPFARGVISASELQERWRGSEGSFAQSGKNSPGQSPISQTEGKVRINIFNSIFFKSRMFTKMSQKS